MSARAEPIYVPSPWQLEFHSLGTHEALGAGAAGVGKTLCGLMDPLPQIAIEHERMVNPEHQYPLRKGESTGWALHLRREFTMLKETLARAHRIFPRIDPNVRWLAQDHTFIFSSGYRFEFGSCQHEEDYNHYLSSQITHLFFDELTQFTQEQYEQIDTRVRSADPVLRTMLKTRAMSNPKANWVRDMFVEPHPDGRRIIKKKIVMFDGSTQYRTRIYLPGMIKDNPDKDFARDYEAKLRGKPAHIIQAFLLGNWYAFPGSYFGDEWTEDLHVCKPFRIPDHWPRFRSMDWGYKQPGCVHWWAIDDEETLYCEREYTFQNRDVIEVAKRIGEIERDLGLWDKKHNRSLITGPADTQLWEQRGDRVLTKAAEMARHGVPWAQADKGSRERAAQLLLGRIRDHRNRTRQPGFVAFETCTMLRRTLPGIMADKKNPECPEDGGDDHWLDSACYACSYASHGKRMIGQFRRRDDDDFDDDETTVARTTNRYAYGQGTN